MRSSNPVLSAKLFSGYSRLAAGEYMTIDGTVNKTFMLLLIVMMGAFYTWTRFAAGAAQLAMMLMFGGMIAGLILALTTTFKMAWAPVTAPLYALAEGLFLGGVSVTIPAQYHYLVFQAVLLTFGVLFTMLAAYRAHLVRATQNFKMGVMAATGGICFLYVVSMAMSFFGLRMPFIYQSGLIGIGFSLFVVVIAALNLVMDFDFIEQGASAAAPKFMEWYGAFALMVTLVWLYIEILNLLMKLNSNRR